MNGTKKEKWKVKKLCEFNGMVFYKIKKKASDGKEYEVIESYFKDYKEPDNSWLSQRKVFMPKRSK